MTSTLPICDTRPTSFRPRSSSIKCSARTTINTNVAYQFGSIGNSRLDFNGAANPDPTYYRNLPSYFSTASAPQADIDRQRNFFLANSQINWDALYYGNTEAITNSDNIEIGRRAKESGAILYEDRTDDKQWTANTILNSQLSDNIILNAGATYRKLKSENFQNVLDLLGHPFDFRTPANCPSTIDDSFVIETKNDIAAALYSPTNGLRMTVYTNQPSVHVFVGGNCSNKIRGKEDAIYHSLSGICFEAQNFPDAPNQNKFPNSVLRKEDKYYHKTIYKFQSI